MTARFRGLLVGPLTLALATLLAPPAGADAYTDDVVNRFNDQTHVVADPTATPPLQNPDEVNQRILTSRWTWSPAPPVWVAAVAPSQTDVTTPDSIHHSILGRNPEFGGVILVIDAKGYHVRAYNVPKAIADNVDPFMGQAARSHHNDPNGATTEFVSKLAGLNVSSGEPATTSPVVNQKHTSWAWLWETLIVIGIALVVAGLIWFAVGRNRKRHNNSASREQVKQELIYAESDVNDLASAVLNNSSTDVSAESMKATSSLGDARRAYETGDFTAARAHLRTVQAAVAKANRKLSPEDRTAGPGSYPPKPDVGAVRSVPDAERKEAEVRTTDPNTGRYVTINNNNYSTTQQPAYPHYYPGGYYNGMFFYPGYYPYAFWGPGWGWSLTDVLLMDALLDDHWGGSYERGFEAGQDSTYVTSDSGQSANYNSQQGDVGFDGSYQQSGGGDVSFGGNDYSGGYDSGGGADGGFDSGGAGSRGTRFDSDVRPLGPSVWFESCRGGATASANRPGTSTLGRMSKWSRGSASRHTSRRSSLTGAEPRRKLLSSDLPGVDALGADREPRLCASCGQLPCRTAAGRPLPIAMWRNSQCGRSARSQGLDLRRVRVDVNSLLAATTSPSPRASCT